MATVNSPRTGKRVVTKGAHFQSPLFERPADEDDGGRKTTQKHYGFTDEAWRERWNVPRTPEPEDSAAGDALLMKVVGNFRAADFADREMAVVPFVGNPEIPFGKPVRSYFGRVRGGPTDSRDYIVCNRAVVGPFTRALAKTFEFWHRQHYELRSFCSYAPRNKRAREPGAKGKLSNHSLGIALDINPSQNEQGDYIWDMPKEIVAFFMEEGFYWGGLYKTTPDAMHFEFKLPFIPRGGRAPARVVFPLGQPNSGLIESPVSYYRNNEDPRTGAGGYYGLGLQRNLHGGIHLFPGTGGAPAPVNAVAPGYIVAARLPDLPEKDPVAQDVLKHVGNWPGFVLLRHDVSMLPKTAKENDKPKTGTFYSLYMHLASPSADDELKQSYVEHVPWFREALKRQHGCWTKISHDGDEPAGTCYWSKEKVDPQSPKPKYAVHGRDEEIEVRGADKVTRWFFKAPPADFAKVVEALLAGKLVTFTEPFFPIPYAGEPVGITSGPRLPWTGVPWKAYEVNGEKKKAAVSPGFLHWEVFAPIKDGGSAIRDVVKLARETFPDLAGVLSDANVITETTPDNFLETSEIKGKLLPRLPERDRNALAKALDAAESGPMLPGREMAYGSTLLGLYADATSFAPDTPGDAQGKLADAEFTYPVTLQVEVERLVPPDRLADGGPYELTLEYFEAPKPNLKKKGKTSEGRSLGKQTLEIDAGKWKLVDDPLTGGKMMTFTLRVPAAAAKVRVVGAKNIIPSAPQHEPVEGGAALLKTLAPERFRGTRATHLTEWAPSAVDKLWKKLKEKQLVGPRFDPQTMQALSWWHKEGFSVFRWFVKNAPWSDEPKDGDAGLKPLVRPPKEETVKAITHKGDSSLFGDGPGQLPVDATVDNFHPVTFLWLLALLRDTKIPVPASAEGEPPKKPKQPEVLDVQVPSRALFHKEDPEPLAWGWVFDPRRPPGLGDEAALLVIDDDYGYDPTVRVDVTLDVGGVKFAVAKQSPYGENGILSQQVEVDFWGTAKVMVAGKSAPKTTLNTLTLQVPAPALQDTSAEEVTRSMHVPRPFGGRVIWPVKVQKGAAKPRRVCGFVGLEVSKDGGPWQEAKVQGRTSMIPAQALGGSAPDEVKVDPEVFELRDDFIVDLKPKRKDADPFVTKSVRHSKYQHAYRDLQVSCALAQALHQLREAHRAVSVVRLSRDGLGCVIQGGKWPALRPVALWCLESGLFREVALWSTGASLTAADLALDSPRAAEIGKALKEGGLKLVVTGPKPIDQCAAILAGNVKTTLDKTSIVGMADGASSITPRLKGDDLVAKAPAIIAVALAQGLEKLASAAKKALTIVHLSRDGQSCLLSAPALLPHALENPHFTQAQVVERGKEKLLMVTAPARHAVTVVFDPKPLLTALRADAVASGHLTRDGQSLAYRYYFCAVNGYGQLGGPPSPPAGFAFQEELRGFRKSPPHAVTAKCPAAAGVLRPLGFASGKVRLIENEVVVDVALIGNAASWAGLQVKATRKAQKKAAKVTVAEDGSSLRTTGPIPKENALEITFAVEAPPNAVGASVPPLTVTADLTPKFVGPLHVLSIGEHLVLWCRTSGVPAPKGGGQALPFVYPGPPQAGNVGSEHRSPYATAFEVLIAPNDTLPGKKKSSLQAKVQYYLPGRGPFGFVNHDGVFAARIAKALLRPDTRYSLQVAMRGRGRGPATPLEAPLQTDSSFGLLAGVVP